MDFRVRPRPPLVREAFDGMNSASRSGQLRKERASDAHGHDHVAVAAGVLAEGVELAGGLFVFQLETDWAIRRGGQKIEKVLRVEADGDRFALEFFFDDFFCFSVLGARRGNFQAFLGEHEFHGVRALIGQLRNAAERVLEFAALDGDSFIHVAWQHSFVIRELAGEFATSEQAAAKLEEEMAFILPEFDDGIIARFRSKALHFVHGFLGDKHTSLGGESIKRMICLDHCQTVAVRRDHRERTGLHHEQRAIQRIARFFQGNRECGLGDHARE